MAVKACNVAQPIALDPLPLAFGDHRYRMGVFSLPFAHVIFRHAR